MVQQREVDTLNDIVGESVPSRGRRLVALLYNVMNFIVCNWEKLVCKVSCRRNGLVK